MKILLKAVCESDSEFYGQGGFDPVGWEDDLVGGPKLFIRMFRGSFFVGT